MHIIENCPYKYIFLTTNDINRQKGLDGLLNSAQGVNKVTVMLLAGKKVKKMDFTVLYASDSLISMQFSKYMKLPQVFQPQL